MKQNYTEFVELATELVSEFGRPVSLFKTTRAPSDSTKPWNGPQVWDDATATQQQLVQVDAAFIGDLLAGTGGTITGSVRSTLDPFLTNLGNDIFLVSGAAEVDLKDFDKLLDGTILWNIDKVVSIKPGDTVVLYGIGVSR